MHTNEPVHTWDEPSQPQPRPAAGLVAEQVAPAGPGDDVAAVHRPAHDAERRRHRREPLQVEVVALRGRRGGPATPCATSRGLSSSSAHTTSTFSAASRAGTSWARATNPVRGPASTADVHARVEHPPALAATEPADLLAQQHASSHVGADGRGRAWSRREACSVPRPPGRGRPQGRRGRRCDNVTGKLHRSAARCRCHLRRTVNGDHRRGLRAQARRARRAASCRRGGAAARRPARGRQLPPRRPRVRQRRRAGVRRRTSRRSAASSREAGVEHEVRQLVRGMDPADDLVERRGRGVRPSSS